MPWGQKHIDLQHEFFSRRGFSTHLRVSADCKQHHQLHESIIGQSISPNGVSCSSKWANLVWLEREKGSRLASSPISMRTNCTNFLIVQPSLLPFFCSSPIRKLQPVYQLSLVNSEKELIGSKFWRSLLLHKQMTNVRMVITLSLNGMCN